MRANFVVLHQAPQELVVRFDISLPRAMTRAAGLDRCRRFAHAICDAPPSVPLMTRVEITRFRARAPDLGRSR